MCLQSSSSTSDSVCAKVRVRIIQDLILTRDAFNARLEMENGETSALENIKVEIRITKTFGNGESAKDTFSIGKKLYWQQLSVNCFIHVFIYERLKLNISCKTHILS